MDRQLDYLLRIVHQRGAVRAHCVVGTREPGNCGAAVGAATWLRVRVGVQGLGLGLGLGLERGLGLARAANRAEL